MNAIADVAYVLNEWLDRHTSRRNTSDMFAVGVLMAFNAMNVLSAIFGFYGFEIYSKLYHGYRPFLVPALILIIAFYDAAFLRLCRSAKARIGEMSQEESFRRQSRAWRLLWSYFVLTIIFSGVAFVLTVRRWPR